MSQPKKTIPVPRKYSLEELQSLRKYAISERQTEIIEAIIAGGSIKAAAKTLGIVDRNIKRAVDRAHRTAYWQGKLDGGGPQEVVPETHYLKGVSTYYDKDGNIGGRWFKTNAKMADMMQGLRDFAEGLGSVQSGKFKPLKTPKSCDKDLLTVYPLADLHLGMLAWSKETREDYDTTIAAEALRVAAQLLVAKSEPSEQCVIANLGDFFHFDNDNKQTSSGNILDVDSRWSSVVDLGVKCLLDFVTLALQKHKTVKLVNSIGNHDGQSALMLPFILKPYFINEPRVIIEDAPRLHHYHIFGSNLLGFHHGHKTAPARLAPAMMNDTLLNPKIDTSEVEFVHLLTGHIHHESKEYDGVLVESFRTLCAKDAYHAGSGYRALRDMQTVTYHKKFGECGRERVSYKMLQHVSGLQNLKNSKSK